MSIDNEFRTLIQADFSGGMNTFLRPEQMPKNVAELVENGWSRPKFKTLYKRGGCRKYSLAAIPGAGPARGLIRWYPQIGGALTIAVGKDKNVYEDDGIGTFTKLSSNSAFANDGDVTFLPWRDWLLMTNNLDDRPYAWDGTIFRAMGLPFPDTKPNITVGDSGSITGIYRYKVSFVYDRGESKPSPASDPFTASNDKVLVALPIGGADCIARNIYRTEAGATQFLYLDTVNNNVDIEYEDTEANDATLGDGTELIDDNDLPPKCKYMAEYNGRVYFLDDDNQLWYSKVNQPDAVPGTNVLMIGGDKGDEATGLMVVGGVLQVFKGRSIHPVRDYGGGVVGQGDPFVYAGAYAPRSLVRTPSGCVFLGHDGLYHFNGANTPKRIIPDDIEGLSAGNRHLAAGCLYKEHYLLAIDSTGATPAYNDTIIAFDLENGAWYRWRGTNYCPRLWCSFDGEADAAQLYFVHASTGYIYRGDYGHYDDTMATPVSETYSKTFVFTGGPYSPIEFKVRDIRFDTEMSGGGEIEVDFQPNGEGHVYKVILTLKSAFVLWGGTTWRSKLLPRILSCIWNRGTKTRAVKSVVLPPCRSMKVTVRYTKNAAFVLKAFEMQYQAVARRTR